MKLYLYYTEAFKNQICQDWCNQRTECSGYQSFTNMKDNYTCTYYKNDNLEKTTPNTVKEQKNKIYVYCNQKQKKTYTLSLTPTTEKFKIKKIP